MGPEFEFDELIESCIVRSLDNKYHSFKFGYWNKQNIKHTL